MAKHPGGYGIRPYRGGSAFSAFRVCGSLRKAPAGEHVRPYRALISVYSKIAKLCAPRDSVSLTISALPIVY